MGQLIDRTMAPNAANLGIAKSFLEQIGVGRGDVDRPDSSLFIINRDPARAIRRGRQIFQRKFTREQGQGPLTGDGAGNPEIDKIIGAGLMDSCAGCHGRPRGAAGFGGDVVTRPDSRDAPHLFGLGLKEMLADQITSDLRRIRADAIGMPAGTRRSVTRQLRVSVTSATLDTARSRLSRTAAWIRHGWKASIPTCGSGRSSLMAKPCRFVSSSWAPSTRRWASKLRTPTCLPRRGAVESSRPPGWCSTAARTPSKRRRSAASTRTSTGTA